MEKVVQFIITSVLIFAASKDVKSGCIPPDSDSTNISVYYGWPFTLGCWMAYETVEYEDEIDYSDRPIECVITDVANELILLNKTRNETLSDSEYVQIDDYGFPIDNITEASSSEYQIFLKIKDNCLTLNVKLHKMVLLGESCEENMQRANEVSTETDAQQYFQLLCDVPFDDQSPLPEELISSKDFDRLDANVRWLFNCKSVLPRNAEISGTKLQFRDIEYSLNPGVYTCAVEYNGMTRYRVHYKMCVSPPNSLIISGICNNEVAKIGGNVAVECNIDAGSGATQDIGFKGNFRKKNQFGQDEYLCSSLNTSPHKRISCNITRNKVQVDRCFSHVPTATEEQAHKTKFKFVYIIRNIQESDFGTFEMYFERAANVYVTVDFTLKVDTEQNSYQTQKLLKIIFAVVGTTLLIFLFLCIFFRLEIRWMWHKLGKSHEKGSKEYAAYLAYYYSKDMGETNPSLFGNFVDQLHSHFRSSGAKVFDAYRDSSTHLYKAESIASTLADCHRVIIILTPEYIKDQWGVYEAYEAWKTIIESPGVKILFLAFPTTNSTISNLPEGLRIALKQALKRHEVIHSDGKLPISKRMMMRLDIFMPKLEQKNHVKVNHDSSNLTDPSEVNSEDNNLRDGNRV